MDDAQEALVSLGMLKESDEGSSEESLMALGFSKNT